VFLLLQIVVSMRERATAHAASTHSTDRSSSRHRPLSIITARGSERPPHGAPLYHVSDIFPDCSVHAQERQLARLHDWSVRRAAWFG